ncbi:DUF421 domain-containing protein [Crassaminicella thermophila]|uniref:DUF421 domain-containing protein n=1 Tax=Crassaminicella thermophila TaxID=2599308 RepID=A0A5C0SI06_CRATE|nr:DUF421 domain-containing protein [Crassaminicella thermophila]QEK12838.1 DUF421 domain-containing protein [Crassaminicella thermophila]
MKELFEVIIQTFLAFFSILFITRLLGRQQVSQLTLYEYINGITFGSIAATLATDINTKTYQHLVGLVLFGILTGVVSMISMKKRSFRKVVNGEPIIIIEKGKLLEKNLKRTRYSMDEINQLLRQKDCFSPDEVEYGLLETNGDLSIIKRQDKRNVTIGDLNLVAPSESIPTEIIIGGQIIYENLRKRQLTGKDLINNLKMFNVSRVEEVMYATIDLNGKMYVDKYDDHLNNNIDISEDNEGI